MFDIIILVLVIISYDGGVVVEQIRVKDVEECNTLLTKIKSDHSGRHSIRGYCIKEQPR